MSNSKKKCYLLFLLILFSCSNKEKEVKYFYPDGKLLSISKYKNGIKTDSITYFENGKISILRSYLNKGDQQIITNYENGNIERVLNINTLSHDGSIYEYFSDKKLRRITFFKSDSEVYVKELNTSGKVIREDRLASLIELKDTIHMDDYFDATVSVYGPPIKGVAILYGCITTPRIVGNYKFINGNAVALDTLKNMQFKIHLKPKESGISFFSGIIRAVDYDGIKDSVSIIKMKTKAFYVTK